MSKVILERMREAASRAEKDRSYKVLKFLGCRASPCRLRCGGVGLELEIEGRNLPYVIPYTTPVTEIYWTAEKDGSLRGEESYEYITNGPINIDEVPGMLDTLWNSFDSNKSKLSLSNRCSTHVHLNMSMFTPKPITSLIALYGIVEEVATNWCGDGRVSNPFCLRMKDSQATLELWQNLLEGGDIANYGGERDRDHQWKYGGLNILPLFTKGSVEFRPLRGAENKKMVIDWVNFLWALREEARTTYADPGHLASMVSANGATGVVNDLVARHGLRMFWGEVIAHPSNRDGNVPKMLRDGFNMVQPLLFNTDWTLTPSVIEKGDVPKAEFEKALKAEPAQWDPAPPPVGWRDVAPAALRRKPARPAALEEAVAIQAAQLAGQIDQNILKQLIEGAAAPRARRLEPFPGPNAGDYNPFINRREEF